VGINDAGMSDGYETDSASMMSTSLALSARDYAFENGCQYYRFYKGSYYFLNNNLEQEREDIIYALIISFCNRLYFAPIETNL
jgi:hypothetical protein